jgi:hypothetical protein
VRLDGGAEQAEVDLVDRALGLPLVDRLGGGGAATRRGAGGEGGANRERGRMSERESEELRALRIGRGGESTVDGFSSEGGRLNLGSASIKC